MNDDTARNALAHVLRDVYGQLLPGDEAITQWRRDADALLPVVRNLIADELRDVAATVAGRRPADQFIHATSLNDRARALQETQP